MDVNLKTVHEELFNQLALVDEICKKYQIRYSLFYGTLLGAVREKNIIPWDDDVDLVFEKRELEKFEEAFRKEAPEEYEFGYDGLWVQRLKPRQKAFISGVWYPSISTDFLVVSGVPHSIFAHKCRVLCLKILQGMIKRKINWGKGGFILKLAQITTWALGRLLPYRWKLKIYNHLLNIFDGKGDKVFVGNGEFQHMNICYSKLSFSSSERRAFGYLELPIMKGYNEVLTKIYGDYLTPPPESEREYRHLRTTE